MLILKDSIGNILLEIDPEQVHEYSSCFLKDSLLFLVCFKTTFRNKSLNDGRLPSLILCYNKIIESLIDELNDRAEYELRKVISENHPDQFDDDS